MALICEGRNGGDGEMACGQDRDGGVDVGIWRYDKRTKMIKLLEISNGYWRLAKGISTEAAKARKVFSYILMKAKGSMEPEVAASTAGDGNGVQMEGFSSTGFVDDRDMLDLMNDQVMLDFDWVSATHIVENILLG